MRLITSLVYLLTACLLISCQSLKPLRHAEDPRGPHFRFMTYNISWAGPMPGRTLDTINNANADVICLQEITTEWEKYLRANLGNHYPYARFQYTPNRAEGGLGILSRYPMSETSYIRNHVGWYNGWVVKTSTPVGNVQVLMVHLKPATDEDGNTSVGGVLVPANIHEREISRFWQYVKPDMPTIVAGDFNEDNNEKGSAIRWLEDRDMINALPEFDRTTPTWHWRSGGLTAQRRLDHIFYSTQLYCFQARVIDAGGSDHRPVVAVFGNRASALAK